MSYTHISVMLIPEVAYALMRSVSILELCLLGFLCLCLNALKTFDAGPGVWNRPWFRTHVCERLHIYRVEYGVILAECAIQYCISDRHSVLLNVARVLRLPEPARKPVVMPANSTIYRWNEIAAALGHGTQVAVQQPANSFFLTDVETSGGEGIDA